MISAPTDAGILHPGINRALAAYPELYSRRATAALKTILYDRIFTDRDRAWCGSRLTGDGFPVEMNFTTVDDRLRYTVEPTSTHVEPRRRFDIASQLTYALCPVVIPEDVITAFRRMQSYGNLLYGSWIGCRHGPVHDEYKIYVEAPDLGGTCGGPEYMPFKCPEPRLPDRALKLRMISYLPASEQCELYYRVKSMSPHHVQRLLAPCGLESRTKELLNYLVETYGYQLGVRLPGASVGLSYSVKSSEEPRSVTLFFFARVYWGADASIRKKFGRFSRALGWNDSRYQQITAELSSNRGWATHHGIFGITLTRNGQLSLSIGVRPPGAVR